uniref:ATPase H+ transporting accessory protein 1 like b n=1 Tax=Erpetoichthys calabaricus TaxID=27687 RepID=A0A8C4T7G0_ERPCA
TRNWSYSGSLLETLPSRTRASYTPLNVTVNGKSCILFCAKKLEVKLKDHTQLDLTGRIFGPNITVVCVSFPRNIGVLRLLMSNTYYDSAGQNWFSLDSVHILYNKTSEVRFNATEIYAPATSSYHCQHVSSLQKYDTLLVPSTQADGATLQHVTFTDFQIQAFSIQDGQFASATDCASFFTPAILMGLIMSLILLLVLAYALHMVVHLKSIERYDEHKTVYFPKTQSSDSALHPLKGRDKEVFNKYTVI